jgi:hypothetical protein
MISWAFKSNVNAFAGVFVAKKSGVYFWTIADI